MGKDDPETKCPYNKSHVLLKSRMQTHLVKCQKAHANSQVNSNAVPLLKCKYNANHHVEAHELDHHHQCCPDVKILVRHLVAVGERKLIPYQQIELPPADEDWDAEQAVPTYDPAANAASKRVLRQLKGESKAKRKMFRLLERDRISRFDDDNAAAVVGKPIQMNSVEKHAFTNEPLRMPRGLSLATMNSQLGQGRGCGKAVPPDMILPGVGRGTSLPPNFNKRHLQSSCLSTSSTNEDYYHSSQNQSYSSLSTEDKDLVEATANLKMANGENEKKKKVPQTHGESNTQTWQNNGKKTDFPTLPSWGRGKF